LTSCGREEGSEKISGSRSRLVFCGKLEEGKGVSMVTDTSLCEESKKYASEESCDLEDEFVNRECFEKALWFTGPWGGCSKGACQGTRARSVLCMVGNMSTSDVSKCGEEGVVFATEECAKCEEVAMTTESAVSMVTKGAKGNVFSILQVVSMVTTAIICRRADDDG
jgi:hypothetical protein